MSVARPTPDDARGLDWWNALDESGRRRWLDLAKSARPVDAWRTYQRTRKIERELQ